MKQVMLGKTGVQVSALHLCYRECGLKVDRCARCNEGVFAQRSEEGNQQRFFML